MFPRLSQFDLHHRIENNPSPTLVFFSSPSCGSCRQLRTALGELRRRRPEWLVYEIDAEQEGGLVREFEVFHLPAMFLFHRGRFHREISCPPTASEIETAVLAGLVQPPQEAP